MVRMVQMLQASSRKRPVSIPSSQNLPRGKLSFRSIRISLERSWKARLRSTHRERKAEGHLATHMAMGHSLWLHVDVD